MNIIILADQAWDFNIGSNIKNIAQEFSKKHRVLYINPPLDRITRIRNPNGKQVKSRLSVINGDSNSLEESSKNLWVYTPMHLAESINWIPFTFLFNRFNFNVNKKLAKEIKIVIADLAFDSFIIFNDSLMFKGFYMKELLEPVASYYYIRDNLVSQPYFKKHGVSLEKELIRKSDAVFVNSTYLERYALKHNQKSAFVGQGCELEQFNAEKPYLRPDDFPSTDSPIIGYVGFLTTMRLDLSLLEKIALEHPEWQLVLVGPMDEAFNASSLHSLPQVSFLGTKLPDELPAYIAHFDVCINPQLINEMTIGNYPRKIDEYLSMGKTVVKRKIRRMVVSS